MDTKTEDDTVENKTENKKKQEKEKVLKIDFKMVTFSLGGKDYGIDIMDVKEICKDNKFTMVPNTPSFVKGVYNLRGDIISIIDLRKMFNLPLAQKTDKVIENIIILRIKQNTIGIIVDSISKVIGLDSDTIQPPHPIFADINIKYIKGVVEVNNKLYIILDVLCIFGEEREIPLIERGIEKYEKPAIAKPKKRKQKSIKELDFIIETLETFKNFYVTELNQKWVDTRFPEWKALRKSQSKEIQLSTPEDADNFLTPFYSSCTNMLWSGKYIENFLNILPTKISHAFTVWNPGCGKGYESYSLACILKFKYKNSQIKIWACDKNLLFISTAPSMYFSKEEIPDFYLKNNFVESKDGGLQFSKMIKDSIHFEYHDILHQTQLPELDVIVARDIISFISPTNQINILNNFKDILNPDGILILGENEILKDKDWIPIQKGVLSAYRNKKK